MKQKTIKIGSKRGRPRIELSGKWLERKGYRVGRTVEVAELEDSLNITRARPDHVYEVTTSPSQTDNYELIEQYVELRMKRHPRLDVTIRSPSDAYNVVRHIEDLDREVMLGLYLDTRKQLNAISQISMGTLCTTLVHPREVFKPALLTNSASVLLAHNHPSGNPEPSDDDLRLTRRISQAGEILGVPLVDHLMIGNNEYHSLRETGHLQ